MPNDTTVFNWSDGFSAKFRPMKTGPSANRLIFRNNQIKKLHISQLLEPHQVSPARY